MGERCYYNGFILAQKVLSSDQSSALAEDLKGFWGSEFCEMVGLTKAKRKRGYEKLVYSKLQQHEPAKGVFKAKDSYKHDWQASFLEEVTLDSIFGTADPPSNKDPIEAQKARLTKAIDAASGPAPDDIQPARIGNLRPA